MGACVCTLYMCAFTCTPKPMILYMYLHSTYCISGIIGEIYIWGIPFWMVLMNIKFGELNLNAMNYCYSQ